MIEIAISMGIIAIALVAIIGILPKGLSTQKDNRDDTIMNQDGPFFLEAIRNGAQGLDHLTNYVEWIQVSNNLGVVVFYDDRVTPAPPLPAGTPIGTMRDGRTIIGLLSRPKYMPPDTNATHVRALVRSLSGAAVEQGKAARDFAFNYLLVPEVVSVPTIHVPFNDLGRSNEVRQLTNSVVAEARHGNFHDIRLTFRWPVKPNFEVAPGAGRKVFRGVVSGSIAQDTSLFFIQPQFFAPVQ